MATDKKIRSDYRRIVGKQPGRMSRDSMLAKIAAKNNPGLKDPPGLLESDPAETGTVTIDTPIIPDPIPPTQKSTLPVSDGTPALNSGTPECAKNGGTVALPYDAAALTQDILMAVKFGDGAKLQAALGPVLAVLGAQKPATNEEDDWGIAAGVEARLATMAEPVAGLVPERLDLPPIATTSLLNALMPAPPSDSAVVVGACTEAQVLEAVRAYMDKGMVVRFAGSTWEFRVRDRMDSGTMVQPVKQIKRCAELLCRASVSSNLVLKAG